MSHSNATFEKTRKTREAKPFADYKAQRNHQGKYQQEAIRQARQAAHESR